MATQHDKSDWPALPFPEWADTAATLHMWTQIIGKIRMEFTPWTNHSWHVTLYLTARGLTTSPIPHGTRTFEIRFDFLDHNLRILASDGEQRSLKLEPRSVAEFYRELTGALREIGIPVQINLVPNEIQDPIPFDRDEQHRAYDAEYANRFWRVLVQADRIFKEFRARFCGKCSPVHFFWGSFDLAVTRFSGRPAPPHPGGIPHLPDAVTREAYSQEVSSLGFWPGNAAIPTPIFIPTPIRNRLVLRTQKSILRRRLITNNCTNGRCLTMPCAVRHRPTTRCCSSRKAPTTLLQRWQNGTGPRSKRRNQPCILAARFVIKRGDGEKRRDTDGVVRSAEWLAPALWGFRSARPQRGVARISHRRSA